MTGDRYTAVRYCPQCGCETTQSLDIRDSVIHVDCAQCWGSFDLPRIAPGGQAAGP